MSCMSYIYRIYKTHRKCKTFSQSGHGANKDMQYMSQKLNTVQIGRI